MSHESPGLACRVHDWLHELRRGDSQIAEPEAAQIHFSGKSTVPCVDRRHRKAHSARGLAKALAHTLRACPCAGALFSRIPALSATLYWILTQGSHQVFSLRATDVDFPGSESDDLRAAARAAQVEGRTHGDARGRQSATCAAVGAARATGFPDRVRPSL